MFSGITWIFETSRTGKVREGSSPCRGVVAGEREGYGAIGQESHGEARGAGCPSWLPPKTTQADPGRRPATSLCRHPTRASARDSQIVGSSKLLAAQAILAIEHMYG